MDIVGDRKFVELPGEKKHELPPLLVRTSPNVKRLDRVVGMANDLIDADDMIPLPPMESLGQDQEVDRRKMDLAITLVDQYLHLVTQWQWGDSILDWIRQCEITFGTRLELRNLLRPDVWPHAGRSSFVTLLEDKATPNEGIEFEKAVGLRLTFRQPPPISCFSNQFLFYLNGTVATTAYQTWAHMMPDPISSLPPERFTFDIIDMSLT
ncbi:MAG TPA: hypothetical protein VNV82_16525 [Bryobacteraceae bacterium]|jgi:hypothetical protein|nr:hypothetical protein [Bryobacteraceae bacterium]